MASIINRTVRQRRWRPRKPRTAEIHTHTRDRRKPFVLCAPFHVNASASAHLCSCRSPGLAVELIDMCVRVLKTVYGPQRHGRLRRRRRGRTRGGGEEVSNSGEGRPDRPTVAAGSARCAMESIDSGQKLYALHGRVCIKFMDDRRTHTHATPARSFIIRNGYICAIL